MKALRRVVRAGAVILAAGAFAHAAELEVGADQRPPMPAAGGVDCHIADARPLLDGKWYKRKGYRAAALQEKPLILEESIALDDRVGLKIRQRGCEDVYASFEFTFPSSPQPQNATGAALARAAEALKGLRLGPTALLSKPKLFEIAGALEAAAHASARSEPGKRLDGVVACLSRLRRECATDVAVKLDFPALKVVYVDRP